MSGAGVLYLLFSYKMNEDELKLTARFANKTLIEFFGILKDQSTLLNLINLPEYSLASAFGLLEVFNIVPQIDLSKKNTLIPLDPALFVNKIEFRLNNTKTTPTHLLVNRQAALFYNQLHKKVSGFADSFPPSESTKLNFCSFFLFPLTNSEKIGQGRNGDNIEIINSNLAFLDYDNFKLIRSFGVNF